MKLTMIGIALWMATGRYFTASGGSSFVVHSVTAVVAEWTTADGPGGSYYHQETRSR